MKWKSIVLHATALLAIATLSVALVQAQPQGPGPRGRMNPEERMEGRLDFLSKELKLDETQVEAIRALLEKGRSDAQAWHDANPNADRDDRKAFRDENRAMVESGIRGVLNVEQKKLFDTLKDRRERMGPDRPGRPGGPGMGARVDISDEQRAELEEIRQTLRRESDAWRSEHPDPSKAEIRAFRQAHRAKRIEMMKGVLDESQMAALSDSRRHFRKRMKHAGFWQGFRRLDLSEEQMNSFRGILSADQNDKLDRMMSPSRGPDFREPGTDRMEMLLRQMELTDEQRDQLRQMRERHRAAAKAWHDANPNASRTERRACREEHRKGIQAQLKGILTDEQLQKLESSKMNHRDGRGDAMHWREGRNG